MSRQRRNGHCSRIHWNQSSNGKRAGTNACRWFSCHEAHGRVSLLRIAPVVVFGMMATTPTCVAWSRSQCFSSPQACFSSRQQIGKKSLWSNRPTCQFSATSLSSTVNGAQIEEPEEDYDFYNDEAEDEDDDTPVFNPQLVEDEGPDDSEFDWLPDSVKARYYASAFPRYGAADPPSGGGNQKGTNTGPKETSFASTRQRSFYSDEQEELIEVLGGRELRLVTDDEDDDSMGKREIGYLGDCTLRDIAHDYSVPVCYLADVLVTWGVPVPIDIDSTRLGDMVTGEQVFALLEAIYTLDVAELQDRYSNLSLVHFCDEYEISLQDAFQMAVKKGWSLPFGVQTHLRVEQEDALIRKFAPDVY